MHGFNWDDLRVFLAVARAGRIVNAARKLGLDHTTVARRVSALEAAIGAHLMDRSPRGAILTEHGKFLVTYAERIEAETLAMSSDIGGTDLKLSGPVRLATPEAFGTYLVAPNIKKFIDKHPNIELELVPETRSFSLSKREADVAVSLHCPAAGRVVAQKLSDYRLALYGSRDYLASAPAITEIASLSSHPFVGYIEDLVDLPELRSLDKIISEAHVVFRSSSISVQQSAVLAGVGLGFLHNFSAAMDDRLVMLLPKQIALKRTYWITLHADQKKIPRIRAVIDFIKELVAQNREHL